MKRIIFYLIGLFFISFGVTSIITSGLGASPWDSLFIGLSNTFGLTTGNWLIIICTGLMFLNAYLIRSRPDFPAFITIIIQGFLIDFWLLLIFINVNPNNLMFQCILFLSGFLSIVLGASIYIQVNLALNPIDKLMLAINKRFGISVGLARVLYDILVLIIALLLSGPIFIGTFILAFGIGPVIQFVQNLYSRTNKT